MATDYIRLFNKDLADQILTMELEPLTGFLEENIELLKNKKRFGYSSILFVMEQEGGTVGEVIAGLLSDDYTFTELRRAIALDFAFGDENLNLDYYGCWVEVFNNKPQGAISSLEYSDDEDDGEEWFTLLRPDHVAQIIKSLRKHHNELTIMSEKDVEKVAGFRDSCIANPGYWVAYMHDF